MTPKINSLLTLTLLSAALNGCSGAPAVIRTGDRVELGFSCRLPGGELAATTRPDSAVGDDRRSPFYLPRNGAETVILTAGKQADDLKQDRVSFEEEIMKRLGSSLSGLREGERTVLELQAERYPAATPKDRFLRMATVRKRQKEMRLAPEEYTSRAGKAPEVGQRFVIDPLVPGKVSEVTDKEVVIHFAPEPGKPLLTPFGPVTVRETPTHYELEIATEKGRPVRTGGMVGRISAVERDSFEIDYGHPFGGEKLHCDVKVASIVPAENNNIVPESVPVAAEEKNSVPEPAPAPESGGKTDSHAVKVLDEGLARMSAMPGQLAGTVAVANSGDLVTANYTVTLENGALVATTLEKIALDQAVKKVKWYREPVGYAPVELVAGKQELIPGLGEALVGMKAGVKRRIMLTPDKAFGAPDPLKTQNFPCSQTFPKTIRMPADEYVKRFSAFPQLNKEVELMPYFKSRVTEVTERDVALEFLVADGESFNDSFGTVSVAVAGDRITTTLKPELGAPFPLKDGFGIVSVTDGVTFTVDTNHPLAGKTIVLDVELVSVASPATPAAISWIDNHDAGLARAKQDNKPVFLLLEAEWCGWCKKTVTETIPDPRIMALKDRFIWVRIDSDKEQQYQKQYGQDGFPMMVLMNPDGSVLKKINGYREARALSEEIKAVLN
ncbi:MAG: hypothetical protein A2X82_01515 [Geobacteraceae bacterium GWC2_55_20]|nr:MAG: hypothetical protein A2X82_01515 [Geobacteraceae bacterium GWC2_55_20]OGU24835.1 MAG: hypothetical protein A2X85_00545 [Geobacteraceae bacterium GWF2_54_21]HCE67623.1 hypothetical protein [Geobacter sp.]